MNAREAVFTWMQARAVRHLFGNPGSTEVPFLVGMEEVAHYVLGLQESVVVAMADGYAQGSGRPALVNLHAAPGVGNAIGALHTAAKNRSPLVITAGQQDTRHLFHEPLLAADLVAMARPHVKWAYEVTRAADVPLALERAYHLAATPPTGPVFVSIPSNLWDEEAEPVTPREVFAPGPPQGLDRLAEALGRAARPALIMGATVDRDGAWDAAVRLAEKLGADVFGAPLMSRAGFPTHHPLYRGMLAPAAPRIAQALLGHDVVAVFGAPLFLLYPYLPGTLLPPGVRAYLVTDDPDEAARAPLGSAFVGHVGEALAILADRVPDRGQPLPSTAASEAQRRSAAVRSRRRMGLPYVFHTLARILPPDTIVVDEAISASLALREYVPIRQPGGYFTAASGGLGWAMPAAVGIKLAQPGRPVVAVVGDGSAMYGIQALWTAAREQAAAKFLILNNRGYVILKSYTDAFYPGQRDRVPGLDLPRLDFVGLARSMGVEADRVTRPDALGDALRAMMAHEGPFLLEVHVDPRVPSLF